MVIFLTRGLEKFRLADNPTTRPDAPAETVSAWSPFKQPVFRALWIATVVSNVGTWMQGLGAAWGPEPHVFLEPHPEQGPVLVMVEYLIDPDAWRGFAQAMRPLGQIRRRDGAIRWGLFQDAADPGRYSPPPSR